MMETVFTVVAIAAVAALIMNRRAVMRFMNALKVQLGKAGRAAEAADPLAFYREQVDDAVEQISNARKGLEQAKALVRSVTRQVEDGQRQKARLENRIQVAMENDDPNNTATEYALELAQVEQDLEQNKSQLDHHTESYNNFLKQVQSGQKKVEEARRKADSLGVKLEQSKREAEMAEFRQQFDTNFADGELSRAEQLVNQKIDSNRAVGDVSRDLNSHALAEERDRELEQQAAAKDILDRFRKKEPAKQD